MKSLKVSYIHSVSLLFLRGSPLHSCSGCFSHSSIDLQYMSGSCNIWVCDHINLDFCKIRQLDAVLTSFKQCVTSLNMALKRPSSPPSQRRRGSSSRLPPGLNRSRSRHSGSPDWSVRPLSSSCSGRFSTSGLVARSTQRSDRWTSARWKSCQGSVFLWFGPLSCLSSRV